MDCPILVWMLFTNREMTPEVSVARAVCPGGSHVLTRLASPQEYAKCHAVLRECAPHAPVRNAPSEPETMRECLILVSVASVGCIDVWQPMTDAPPFCRANGRFPAPAPHDAAPSRSPDPMERPNDAGRETLDRAGAYSFSFAFPTPKPNVARLPRPPLTFFRAPFKIRRIQIQHGPDDNPVVAAQRARSMIGYHTSYDHNLVGMAMTQGRREDVVNIGIGIKEISAPPGMSGNDFAISLYHKVRLLPLPLSRA